MIKSGKNISHIENESFANIPLTSIKPHHLQLQTKVENVDSLLEKGLESGKIPFGQQFNLKEKFISIFDGDKLLLKCLQDKNCEADKFSIIMQRSELHRQIAMKTPSISIGVLNQKVGVINENLMNKYFQSSGWTKLEGEVGRNGIDGLFIKKDVNGVIKDLLIAESKYNKSGLQDTNNGQQMTKQWILKKIDDLQKAYPTTNDYKIIQEYVQKDSYRSLLWNLKVENNNLLFDVKKLHDKDGMIVKNNFIGGEKLKINQSGNDSIDLKNPQNKFQEQMIQWFKEETKKAYS
jgi:hypothetical protein